MYAGSTDLARLRYPRRRSRAWGVGRKVGVRAAIGVVAAAVLLLGLAHVAQGSPTGAYETVTVQPGDTLWAIATERYPNSDVREKVDEIEQTNGLSGPVIQPGESLKVPTT